MERDPVCGMTMRPGQEEASFNYQGKVFHFCSTECCKMFQAKPQEYMKHSEGQETQASAR